MSRQKSNKLETPKDILGLYDLPVVEAGCSWEEVLDDWEDEDINLDLPELEIDCW